MDKNHPEVKFGKTGVLIINLGTPDSTSWWDIRKYLREFLSDRRVIEVNPIIWQISKFGEKKAMSHHSCTLQSVKQMNLEIK